MLSCNTRALRKREEHLQVPLSLQTAEAKAKSWKEKIIHIKPYERKVNHKSDVKKQGNLSLGSSINDVKLLRGERILSVTGG